MILNWQVEDDVLTADHPHYHDEGVPLKYRIRQGTSGYWWWGDFEGARVAAGSLPDVLQQCEIDASSPTGIPVAKSNNPGA